MDQANQELNRSLHETIFYPSERIAPMQTAREIPEYTRDLGYGSEDDFIKDITGKFILDSGSGHGGLFKSAAQRNLDVKIVNLNPVLADKDRRWHLNWMPNMEDPAVQSIIDRHNRSAVSAIAPFLPFQDASFDIVLDSAGPLFYSANDQRALYMRILGEYLRVTKNSGKIRFSLPRNGPEYYDELEKLMREHGIVDFSRIELQNLDKPPDLQIACGFEVRKESP